MKIAYFDTLAGISGDMTLGALISAGVRLDDVRERIGLLGLKGVEVEAHHIQRNGIAALKVEVIVSEQSTRHRHLRDILSIIDASELSARVKLQSRMMFETIAVAEASVHETTVEKVHFHEVGALDSIVDIVGCAVCLELLGVDRVYSSAVKLGSGGFVQTEHGELPLPGPATVEILRDYPVILTDVPFELTTPTGAAIIRALSSGVLSSERFRITSVGYGSGTHDIPGMPNLLRVMIGEMSEETERDELLMIECSIDDMNPQIYPFVLERLFAVGARDALIIPVIMKKGRPGCMISVLVDRSKQDAIVDVLFAETSTIGIRMMPVQRRKLAREEKLFMTSLGEVRAKVVIRARRERIVPEYEECRRLALETKRPIADIYRILEDELNE